MALVVEDGTGVAGAESYASLADAAAYWAKRPQSPLAVSWGAQATPDANREGAMREASAYLDATWGLQYLGIRSTSEQGLLWPRKTAIPDQGCSLPLYRYYGIARPYGREFPVIDPLFLETDACDVDLTVVYGADGYALPALPTPIVSATIELAARALSAPLVEDFLTGQRVQSETAGDTKFTYFDDGGSNPSFGFVATMLITVLGSAGQTGWAWA